MQERSKQVASHSPKFGSVTQSTNAGQNDITSDTASAEFDGDNPSVTITREDGSTLILNKIVGSEELTRVLPGYTFQGDAVLHLEDDSLSLAGIYTNWNSRDHNDFLAGGYWMHIEGNISEFIASDEDLELSDAEFGAFIDGPEISTDSPDLPTSGTAAYRGNAAGLFVYEGTGSIPDQAGEFSTDVSLTANFNSNMISGCMGCANGVYVVAFTKDGQTIKGTQPYKLTLKPTDITGNGSFVGDNIVVLRNDIPTPSTTGSWGGQFSNIPTDDGDPRLAAGTAAAAWTETSGAEGAFIGAWFGTADPPAQ